MVNVTVIALLIAIAASATPAASYTNHTVGGDAGWFFNTTTNTSIIDYSKWAANQTFSLGDFLIFKTNTNQTVVQTYNKTTYQSCNTDDASDDDTFHYDAGSNEFGEARTIAVALTIEGPNYYLSDADDGVQCQNGLSFEIDVKHGQGLPPSLNQPPPPPYMEPPSADSPPSPTVAVAGGQPSGNGDSRNAANMRAVFGVLLLLLV